MGLQFTTPMCFKFVSLPFLSLFLPLVCALVYMHFCLYNTFCSSVASFYLCIQMCNFVSFLCVACDFVAALSKNKRESEREREKNIFIYKFCSFFGLSDRIIIEVLFIKQVYWYKMPANMYVKRVQYVPVKMLLLSNWERDRANKMDRDKERKIEWNSNKKKSTHTTNNNKKVEKTHLHTK